MKNRFSILIICFLVLFLVGCGKSIADITNSDTKSVNSTVNSEIIARIPSDMQNGNSVVSVNSEISNPGYASDNTESNNTETDFKIKKEDAVKKAFTEAKKHEEEYRLVIPESAISNYTCEIRVRDNIYFYDVIFKDLDLKGSDGFKTQIGIWINANTGEVIQVIRYK